MFFLLFWHQHGGLLSGSANYQRIQQVGQHVNKTVPLSNIMWSENIQAKKDYYFAPYKGSGLSPNNSNTNLVNNYY